MKIPMFSFMRNRLSSKETVLSYFLYAIGELFLIALGILLALQLDNWNQKRLNGIRERVLLAEIQDEFIFNKEELVETARSYFKVRENCLKLVDLISEESVTPDEGLLSSLLKRISLTTSADLSKATIDTLKNTSSFHIIRNDELRSKLILWESLLVDYKVREKRAENFTIQRLSPFLSKRVPFPYEIGIIDPRVDDSFIKDIEFENLIKTRARLINNFLNMAEGDRPKMMETIDRIIALSGD
jgi:hypothetical protein